MSDSKAHNTRELISQLLDLHAKLLQTSTQLFTRGQEAEKQYAKLQKEQDKLISRIVGESSDDEARLINQIKSHQARWKTMGMCWDSPMALPALFEAIYRRGWNERAGG